MKKILFEDSLLVSGIMCLPGCGVQIKNKMNACLKKLKEQGVLPEDAQLKMDSEPGATGIHRFHFLIESENEHFTKEEGFDGMLSEALKSSLPARFHVVDYQEKNNKILDKQNLINILINSISMLLIICLLGLFPPSILLTTGLTLISVLTTAFTARHYLSDFFFNLRHKNFSNMATTISLGCFLSLTHTLFHVITMPLMGSSYMTLMNFIMPIALMTCINSMDEIKRFVLQRSAKLQLQGIKTLFPQMAEEYPSQQLSLDDMNLMNKLISNLRQTAANQGKEEIVLTTQEKETLFLNAANSLIMPQKLERQRKSVLSEGMLIEVKPGECFPVDCVLVQGNTVVDASLLTGEPRQSKYTGMDIPSGAINLGGTVVVYATKSAYESLVNNLLFKSNRARQESAPQPQPQPQPQPLSRFTYLYTGLVILSFLTAIIAPLAFGVISLPIVIENVVGILFSICPCTIAIAHQLPRLISIYHRSKKGIHLRDESLNEQTDEFHTLIFDKTGTLTTNSWLVDSPDIALSSPLWERIYLLEEKEGGVHPLAQAIISHYKTVKKKSALFKEVEKNCSEISREHCGLTGRVQGKILDLGNANYLKKVGVVIPETKLNEKLGFSTVYVAEDKVYQGAIYIQHEPRNGIIDSLSRFKKEGKKMIMLTGDSEESAKGFNRQLEYIFDDQNIHAKQTPPEKEKFLEGLMQTQENPEGVCFVGDGLNDGPCSRIITQKKGMSCSMTANDKSIFFTDICLNGSLDYLSDHQNINRFLKLNVRQNQWILAYGILNTLVCMMSFSGIGIALPALVPMAMMFSTTIFVLFNSYRMQLFIDSTIDKITSNWSKKLLASNWSIGLLLGASSLFTLSTLFTVIYTGNLALPSISFVGGVLPILSSMSIVASAALLSLFVGLVITNLITSTKEIGGSKRLETTEQAEYHDIYKPKFFLGQSLTPRKSIQHNEILTNNFDERLTSFTPF